MLGPGAPKRRLGALPPTAPDAKRYRVDDSGKGKRPPWSDKGSGKKGSKGGGGGMLGPPTLSPTASAKGAKGGGGRLGPASPGAFTRSTANGPPRQRPISSEGQPTRPLAVSRPLGRTSLVSGMGARLRASLATKGSGKTAALAPRTVIGARVAPGLGAKGLKGKGGISLLAARRPLAPKGASKSSSADAPPPWSSKGAPRLSSKGAPAASSKGTWQPSKGPSAPGSKGRPPVGGFALRAKGGKGAPPASSKGESSSGSKGTPCAFWAKGNCKNGANCPFTHGGAAGKGAGVATRKGPPAQPVARLVVGTPKGGSSAGSSPRVPPPGRLEAKGKGKGKNKADGKGKGARSSAPARNTVCKFWLDGECKNGKECRFLHSADKADPEKSAPPEDLPEPLNHDLIDAVLSFLDERRGEAEDQQVLEEFPALTKAHLEMHFDIIDDSGKFYVRARDLEAEAAMQDEERGGFGGSREEPVDEQLEEPMDEPLGEEEAGLEGSPGDEPFDPEEEQEFDPEEDPAIAEGAEPDHDDYGMEEDVLGADGPIDEEVRTPEPEDDELVEDAPPPEKRSSATTPSRRVGVIGAPIGARSTASTSKGKGSQGKGVGKTEKGGKYDKGGKKGKDGKHDKGGKDSKGKYDKGGKESKGKGKDSYADRGGKSGKAAFDAFAGRKGSKSEPPSKGSGKSGTPCKFFAKGACTKGPSCPFSHR